MPGRSRDGAAAALPVLETLRQRYYDNMSPFAQAILRGDIQARDRPTHCGELRRAEKALAAIANRVPRASSPPAPTGGRDDA